MLVIFALKWAKGLCLHTGKRNHRSPPRPPSSVLLQPSAAGSLQPPAPSPVPGTLPHAPGPPRSLGPALIPSPQASPPENGGLLPGPDRISALSVPRGTGATPLKLGDCSWPRYLHCLRWAHGSLAKVQGLLVAPLPALSVPGSRRHPTKVGGCSRTHYLQCLCPEEGGTTLKWGAAPGPRSTRPRPPLTPPPGPALTQPEPSRRPSERAPLSPPRSPPPGMRSGPAHEEAAPPPPRDWLARAASGAPIGCSACLFPDHAPPSRPRIPARPRGRPCPPILRSPPRPAARAWSGGARTAPRARPVGPGDAPRRR